MYLLRAFCIVILTLVYGISEIISRKITKDPFSFSKFSMSWAKSLIRVSGISLEVINPHNVELSNDFVIIPNHISLMDIPVLLATIPNIRIMYKKDLQKFPFFGWVLKNSPFIALERDEQKKAYETLQETIETLRVGTSVVIFPEGTRSLDGKLGEFKRGALYMAIKANKPILPVAIIGTNNILPNKTKRITPGNVKIIFSKPIMVPETISRIEEKQLMKEIRNEVLGLLGQSE